MSWSNWDFGGRTDRTTAANQFLQSGNFNTVFGGTQCNGSQDCASGYACVGGRCVQKSAQESSNGGSSCGDGTGGGGCNSTSSPVQLWQNGQLVAGGDVVSSQGTLGGTVYKSYAWAPVYSADGCTVTGCSLQECGGTTEPDCPVGERSCRYDAYGTVNCFCGPPEQRGCSSFCTAYSASNGTDAEGCSGLACDECSYCDEQFVSASGTCRQKTSGGPCHCKNDPIPDCYKCAEDGGVVPAPENCQECVQIVNYDCGCGTTISKTCCQPLGSDGLTLTNQCQDKIDAECADICSSGGGTPVASNPCEGNCVSKTLCQAGTCPDVPTNAPGQRNTATGCIEAGGQGCLLYNECDVSGLPPECSLCDCNCNNDCPSCSVCNAEGKCVPDTSDPECACANGGARYTKWAITVTTKAERASWSWGFGCDRVGPGNCCFSDGRPCSVQCYSFPDPEVTTTTYNYCLESKYQIYWEDAGTSTDGATIPGWCVQAQTVPMQRLYKVDTETGVKSNVDYITNFPAGKIFYASGGGSQNTYVSYSASISAVASKCGGCPP